MTSDEFIKSEKFKEMLQEFDLSLEDFTCFECADRDKCSLSFDLYNTGGDCLACK